MNKKIQNYIVLAIGFLILLFVFYAEPRFDIRGFSLDLRDSMFKDMFEGLIHRHNFDFFEIGWLFHKILLLGFAYYWWKLRFCISNFLFKYLDRFHKKV